MTALVYFGGAYSFLFGLFHLAFWKLFEWKRELPKLNEINRGILQVVNLRLTYLLFVFAFLCFVFPIALLTTSLGRVILGSVSLFWLMRAIEQLIFWKFNKFSCALFIIFLVGAIVFFIPLI